MVRRYNLKFDKPIDFSETFLFTILSSLFYIVALSNLSTTAQSDTLPNLSSEVKHQQQKNLDFI